MKVSYRWLNEFVEIGETPQQLGTRFTNVGLAEEALEKVDNDFVFELEVATNRPDCLSHFGIGREVAGRQLNPSMVVIADANRAIAVAGVMGGAETEISAGTTNVLLESANFDPLSIRKTSRALGLSSEASYRFERGADVEMARFACDRAAALIQLLAGGTIYRDVIDIYPRPRKPVSASLRRQRIKAF